MAVTCSTCNNVFSGKDYQRHIPICYFNFCKKLNIEPCCVCNRCKGVTPHLEPLQENGQADKTEEASFINQLPNEILHLIWKPLNKEESPFLRLVCKLWNSLIPHHHCSLKVVARYYAKQGNLTALKHLKQLSMKRVSNLFSDNIGIQIVTGAAESGNTEILRWATSKNHPSDSNNPCEIPYVHKPAGVSKLAQKQAARFGHLDVLKILKQNRQTMCSGTLNVAASRGDVEMVDWLLSCGVEVGDQASLDAAMAGHFELAKKLIVADTSIRSLLLTAAAKGSLDFLEWLVTKFNYEVSENFTDVAIAAFAGPQMNILEWMVNTGWVCSEEDCNEAANTGNIELVQFTINNGASFNVKTMNAAASHGHLHLVKWLRENGCPWSMKTTRLAAYEGNLETLQWLLQNGCPYDMHSVAKIEAGRLICNQKFRVLKFLGKYGIQLDSSLYVDAISVQNVQFLNYLYDNNLALSAELWWYALQSSSMTALKWLTAKNCPWDSDIFHHGWLSIKALKWIQKNGFELSVQPSINAATIEEISVLKWLKENGWPFSLETTQAAAIQNKYKSFKWLVESGCPVDLELCNRLTLSHEIQFFINNKS